ncbi:NAD(P)-dependent alcohol dehydrogenase [Agromyces sp. MMS24-K17]|uniref:NAD(P)-dependent alcohol dehydrogenase n=1 Tax=Agromyces sp. MMS24-K17 TaxID=3372850 RepID=UPI00375517AB
MIMRTVIVDRYGPPEVARIAEVPMPEPGPGQIRVRVGATIVGAADAVMRAGSPRYARIASGFRRPRHAVPGGDFAGVVDALGEGARWFAVGDRVHGTLAPASGGNAEYLVIAEDAAVVPTPAGLDDAGAAAVVDGFLTATPFLRDLGRVGPGDEVLVVGAAGAVGSSAVQVAKALGARVTAVTSTPNLDLVRALGADLVIDRTAGPAQATAKADLVARGVSGYDVVFDAVGGWSFGTARPLLGPRGAYLTTVPSLGVLALAVPTKLLRRRRTAIAFTGLRSAAAKRADLELLGRLVAEGRIREVVDRVLPLERVADAHRRVDGGHKAGAVVLVTARVEATAR